MLIPRPRSWISNGLQRLQFPVTPLMYTMALGFRPGPAVKVTFPEHRLLSLFLRTVALEGLSDLYHAHELVSERPQWLQMQCYDVA